MTPEQRLEKYYLEKLKKYYYEVNESITAILGEDFKKLLDFKKNNFHLIFAATKNGLEYHLNNTPNMEQKEIMEYFLEKIEDEEKSFTLINKDFPVEKKNKKFQEWLEKDTIYYAYYKHNEQSLISYFKIDVFDIYRNGLLEDSDYIYWLLTHLVTDFKNNSGYEPDNSFSVNCDIENANRRIYSLILNAISLQIVCLLRQKNIYLLDEPNEYDGANNNVYKMVDPRFIATFQDLLPLFLKEPNKFIEIVGIDNFRDFTIYSLDMESGLDLDEIINRMVIERHNKATYQFVSINLPLIAKAKQKIDNETRDKTETTSEFRQSSGLASNIDDIKYNDLIYRDFFKLNHLNNNREDINNNINNKINDNFRYNKLSYIENDESKYNEQDDFRSKRR